MANPYTQSNLPEVEYRIADDQALIGYEVAQCIPVEHLEAVVMIGGYAREEGGYRLTPAGPRAYNDYDYFVVFRDCSRALRAQYMTRLNALAKDLEKQVDVEVDFFPLTPKQIRSLPFTLMYAEMQVGHRVIWGNLRVLESMPAMPLEQLPVSEIKRLMLNRGALLLLNQRKPVLANDWDRDEYNKFINKAVLASGDAFLYRQGAYQCSYREKLKALTTLTAHRSESDRVLLREYKEAVEHKLHPQRSTWNDAALIERQQRVTELWLAQFDALVEFDKRSIDQPDRVNALRLLARNIAVNLRDSLLKGARVPVRQWGEYPRESLYRELPQLLVAHPDPDANDASTQSTPDLWNRAVARFIERWHRYS